MHANQRQGAIMKLLESRGFVSFRELGELLPASPATVRRDLDFLAASGRLTRVRGGASLDGPAEARGDHLSGLPFHENVALHPLEKQRIGAAAAALCRPGEAVIIDGGSTTLAMCPHIAELGLHVLTNSFHIVSVLQRQPGTRISVPAGALFREQSIILSPNDDDGMEGFHASKLFMGAAAIGPQGPMQADVLLIQAERRLLRRARELVLLVDSSKFRQSGGHLLCPFEQIDTVISDSDLAPEHRAMIEDRGARLIIA